MWHHDYMYFKDNHKYLVFGQLSQNWRRGKYETEKWVMENGERLMSVAVWDSSGLETNICQKMRKGENNYGKYKERGTVIRTREQNRKLRK